MQNMLTQEEIKQFLSYCPDTGIFRWRISRPPMGMMGAVAGFSSGHGYQRIGIHGTYYYAHRLAFLYMTGNTPSEVDHINQIRSDNRWKNLRASNRRQNMSNVSGRKGIRPRNGSWAARHGSTHIGTYPSKEEAIEARRSFVASIVGFNPDSPPQ